MPPILLKEKDSLGNPNIDDPWLLSALCHKPLDTILLELQWDRQSKHIIEKNSHNFYIPSTVETHGHVH